MKKSKYLYVNDGEWIVPKRRGYKLICCDCGLTHRINFKLVKTPIGNQIYFQAFRENRVTGQIRRWKNNKYISKYINERTI